ncbi:hypothetical protein [Acinetobacter vivianii]|uniref:hypothetical protein n=1 Tax=Acinetobacter vivianii TaxID=1776742 RepID=UPI002DBD9A6D|nr:hypothetical protein [Acinetobacter vivianii]MEB6479296.1 hypothetical protein [Acinetobacter vivianii]MEB6656873.1 hypothetical protein [Acinetobacter vivianii]
MQGKDKGQLQAIVYSDGLILVPVKGGTSIVLGEVVGAGIGAVLLGVGAGFLGSYGGTTIARKYTGVCN